MTHKVLSREATIRILDHMQNGRPLPQKIVEHKERMEAATAAAERRHHPEDLIDQIEMECLMSMRHGLDTLYTSWAEGIERIRWVDLPERDGITPEIVVRECCMSTESFFGNTGVEVLAAYLDAYGYDRLLFRLGEACTLRVREYIESAVPAPTYDAAILDKPAEHFGTIDQDVLRNKLVGHFILFVNKTSPQHVIRAMIANIEWGMGNAVQAIEQAGFAYCEATVEQFGLKLRTGHPDAEKTFKDWELWKAERLLEFLK
ncbi:hypothetical protein IPH92_03390 [Candidatus Kaiserbacteria bacterium]|nr:MAG: hypothetical protein IPH92_03390 [Candidatus Kaiserbacteria bacterium]